MNSTRENLVFVRGGKTSLHHGWLEGPGDRNWDLIVSQWIDEPDIGADGDLPISIDKGTKWDSIYRYLAANPDVMDRYRYIAFMDDDLVFTKSDLNRYFEICKEHDLLLAQPSLHPDSYFCYAILLQCKGTKLRFSNFVECMATAIRTDYLKSFMPTLSKVKTGWGMDRIWTVTMPDPAFRSAIIDEISMLHTRPHATGGIYKDFAKEKMGPQDELAALVRSYDNIPDKMMVYGGIDNQGQRIGATQTRIANGISLLGHSWRCRDKPRCFKSTIGVFLRALTEVNYLPKPAVPVRQEGILL